jgi:hypothetical protein
LATARQLRTINLTANASRGRARWWKPHYSVGRRWGGQKLAGDEEVWWWAGEAQ